MKTRTQNRRGDEGVALLLALLFVVLLSVIVVEFAYENEVESSFVSAQSEQFESEIAAKSAVSAGLALLAADANLDSLASGTGTGTGTSTKTPTVTPSTGLQGGGQCDSLFDAWAMGVPYRQLNKAVMQCKISDEYGKINLNALLLNTNQTNQNNSNLGGGSSNTNGLQEGLQSSANSDGTTMPEQENTVLIETLRSLFIARGVEADPTDAILDWIDADSDTRTEGAENDFYQATEIPYSAKNAPFDSVEELLMIKGITPAIFFGDPELDQLPLTELLTVHGDRKGRINVNTAQPEVLEAIGMGMGGQEGLADRVLQERESSPIMNMQDAQSRGLADAAPAGTSTNTTTTTTTATPPGTGTTGDPTDPTGLKQNPFVFTSKVFRIRGLGESGKAAVRIEAYVYRGTGMGDALKSSGSISGKPTTGVPGAGVQDDKKAADSKKLSDQGTGTSSQMFRILDWRVER